MAEQEGGERRSLSRRRLIKRAMVAGGVAVWATPLAAAARHGFVGGTSAQLNADQIRADALRRAAELRARFGLGVTAPQQTSPCTGYPATSCVTFECGEAPVQCGQGAGGFVCFCDVDAQGNCVCVNDAFCSQLPNCGAGGCPPGWFCIPSSCCGVPKCAPPCGTAATAQAGVASAAGAGAKISGR